MTVSQLTSKFMKKEDLTNAKIICYVLLCIDNGSFMVSCGYLRHELNLLQVLMSLAFTIRAGELLLLTKMPTSLKLE